MLTDITNGKLVLPEFQRDFRWETDRTARLLSSVLARFPTGALLFWSQATAAGGKTTVGKRAIEGAPEKSVPTFRFILDGQQRLTALYRALYGASEEERYFVSIEALLDVKTLTLTDDIDWDAVVIDRELTAKEKRDLATARKAALEKAQADGTEPEVVFAEHDTPAYQAANWLFPIHRLHDFHDWLDDDLLPELPAGVDKKAAKKALRALYDERLKFLLDYDYPVVTLDQETSLVAVCRIFETLNSSAVMLGPFELLTAKFFPQDINLRDWWDTAKQNHPILAEFEVDPYAILQAVTLRARNSAQRSAVLNQLTADDMKKHWDSTVEGVARSARMLQDDCGVIAASWLPYQMLLVPLGAVWSEIENLTQAKRIDGKSKLKRYFWCTAFTANFDQGANSQAQADYMKLKKWIAGDDTAAPEAVTDALPIRRDVLESATTRKTAYFKALIALLVRAGARDFYEGDKMTPARVREHSIEAHHVFPKKWLSGQSFPESPDLILNQTPINKATNASIGSKSPSTYLDKLKQDVKGNNLTPVLDSHYIDEKCLAADDYSEFITERLTALVKQLDDVIAPKKVV